MPADMDLRAEGCRYRYANGTLAVRDFSGDFPAGEITALFGPNGSGKTTMLKNLAGIYTPAEGKVSLGGRELNRLPPKRRAALTAYVPQQSVPVFPFTVGETVLMGRTPSLGGVFGPNRQDVTKAREALESAGASELWDRCVTELSGGQRQLVLIARAIAQDTPVLLLDEPTASLDLHHQHDIWRLLGALAETGKTIVASVHDPNQVLWFCRRVVVMRYGTVEIQGDSRTIFNDNLLESLYGRGCLRTEAEGLPVILPLFS
ncbi:MAG: ABC transporter ATP-binding protein [Spirochaetales bacterium]|nr:ABC transporter ATP-binding protein [Spirochaetales bacterium]